MQKQLELKTDRGLHDSRPILDSIRRIVQALRVSSRRAELRLGLSGAQLFVLQKLAGADGLSINELATRTLTHQSSVSVVVRRLVERRLVARIRSQRDSRRVELSLTPPGRKMLSRSPAAAQDRLIEAVALMPARQRHQLARLLVELVRRTGISDESPSLFFEERAGLKRKTKEA